MVDMKSWLFDRMSEEELAELAYEFGRRLPHEAMRGIRDVQQPFTGRVSSEAIVEHVARQYGVSTEKIYGPNRDKLSTEARKAACEFMRYGLGLTQQFIGEILGNRDHTTIIYYLETVDRRSESFLFSVAALQKAGLTYDRA